MKTLRFGETTVERCVEAEGPSFFPGFIFPNLDMDAFEAERRDWLDPHYVDTETGRLLMSLHTYIIKTERHTVLVDTCVGDYKHRPDTPAWHMKNGPFLDDMTGMGVTPESVDFVMCTHLHVDHVGWNTRLEDGRWVPTFPNAKYLFHEDEYTHWEVTDMPEGAGNTRRDVFEDSVLPVVEAGQAIMVSDGHRIDDALHIESSPGHTPGHAFLHLETGGGKAVFTGDCMHHPFQVAYPGCNSRYCYDPAQSAGTRREIVERCADTDTVVLAAHFADPVAARIVSNGERWKLDLDIE